MTQSAELMEKESIVEECEKFWVKIVPIRLWKRLWICTCERNGGSGKG